LFTHQHTNNTRLRGGVFFLCFELTGWGDNPVDGQYRVLDGVFVRLPLYCRASCSAPSTQRLSNNLPTPHLLEGRAFAVPRFFAHIHFHGHQLATKLYID
jgi:hypothetical protein